MITIHQRHRQRGRQTERQTTCDHNTAFCTKVHRAVKTAKPYTDRHFLTGYLHPLLSLIALYQNIIRLWLTLLRNTDRRHSLCLHTLQFDVQNILFLWIIVSHPTTGLSLIMEEYAWKRHGTFWFMKNSTDIIRGLESNKMTGVMTAGIMEENGWMDG